MITVSKFSGKRNRELRALIILAVLTNPNISEKQKGRLIVYVMQNLPKIVVSADMKNMKALDLINALNSIKFTGDADCTNPPKTDADYKADATLLLNLHSTREISKDKSLTQQESELVSKLKREYLEAARYVENIANKVAVSKGDVAAGYAVVYRTGFKTRKKGEIHPRQFEVFEAGEGWFRLRLKAVGKRAGYVWRYGLTSVKDTPPTQFRPDIFTLECSLKITNCKSGSIYAFQVAGVLPAEDEVFDDGQANLNFSDFIYVVCL